MHTDWHFPPRAQAGHGPPWAQAGHVPPLWAHIHHAAPPTHAPRGEGVSWEDQHRSAHGEWQAALRDHLAQLRAHIDAAERWLDELDA